MAVTESRNLCRANECEVQRVEKQNNIFLPNVVRELDLDEFLVENSLGLEIRSHISHQRQLSGGPDDEAAAGAGGAGEGNRARRRRRRGGEGLAEAGEGVGDGQGPRRERGVEGFGV